VLLPFDLENEWFEDSEVSYSAFLKRDPISIVEI